MRTSRRILFIGILFILAACQPASLWGTPLPAPTSFSPIPKPTSTRPANSTPLIDPTSSPAAHSALLWIGPAVPPALRETMVEQGLPLTEDRIAANILLDQSTPSEAQTEWIYALVAPFPTVTDGISLYTLRDAWNASATGPFAGLPLWMDQSTLAAFTAKWGEPAPGAVKTAPADRLVDAAWEQMPSWAIIPFEDIEPRWKVLTIDTRSPLHKDFNPAYYPLVAYFGFSSAAQTNSIETKLPATNREPSKLTTLILTGVTALVRATAATMDVKGITYPGEEIREVLREADIAHINNEVPFYGGCPDADPNQESRVFCSAPRYLELLLDIGTDVVELSGDHFADYGRRGMEETLAIYKENNLPYYGGGANIEAGKKPLIMEVNGNKLMFIACNIKSVYASATETNPGAVRCDFPYMTEQIRFHRSLGYLPIATFQYHEFDTPEARPQQEADFHTMADAGAVIVSGSQAHVPQVMEFYNDSFIHYGLGNLFFDQMNFSGGSKVRRREFIDRHVFYNGKYLGVELITTYLEDYSRPRFMTPEERSNFLMEYFQLSGWINK